MKIIKAGYQLITPIDGDVILKRIEEAGRVCYKSEDKITDYSCRKFVKMLIDRGHEAMIEHCALTVKFICDRGVSHEIVRHRLASFAQESTRYCNYSAEKFGSEITVIRPCWVKDMLADNYIVEYNSNCMNGCVERFVYPEPPDSAEVWVKAMCETERAYFNMLSQGASPQEARSVLPNSLKTELVVTMNLREWRHFFKLRTASAAHPQMREITIPLLRELKEKIPVIFDDIDIP